MSKRSTTIKGQMLTYVRCRAPPESRPGGAAAGGRSARDSQAPSSPDHKTVT